MDIIKLLEKCQKFVETVSVQTIKAKVDLADFDLLEEIEVYIEDFRPAGRDRISLLDKGTRALQGYTLINLKEIL